jgi:hypothetical protein
MASEMYEGLKSFQTTTEDKHLYFNSGQQGASNDPNELNLSIHNPRCLFLDSIEN